MTEKLSFFLVNFYIIFTIVVILLFNHYLIVFISMKNCKTYENLVKMSKIYALLNISQSYPLSQIADLWLIVAPGPCVCHP